MVKTLNSDKIKPSPTLSTILMVEDALKTVNAAFNSCRTQK